MRDLEIYPKQVVLGKTVVVVPEISRGCNGCVFIGKSVLGVHCKVIQNDRSATQPCYDKHELRAPNIVIEATQEAYEKYIAARTTIKLKHD